MSNNKTKLFIYIGLTIGLSLVFWTCSPKHVAIIGPDGKKITWEEMSLEQKKAHMQKAIMPKAAKLFKEWRPKKYSHTDCRLCHGPVITNGNFNMPAENLPRLSGKVLLGPEFNNHPQTTRLKLDQLVPLMSKALGKKSFNIITRNGFGCYSCHLGPSGPMFGN